MRGAGFSIAGIPIRVEPLYIIIIGALGLVYPMPFTITWILIATLSLIVHEMGHAIAFRAYGLKPSITLHGMGGLTTASLDEPGARPFTPLRSIVTSLAGPFSALFLFGVPAYLVALGQGFDPWQLTQLVGSGLPNSDLEVLLGQIVYINVGWSLLNLLPLLPLDGGNVTASMCEIVSPRSGRRVANIISIVGALALGWVGLNYGYVGAPLIAMLFIGMNISELFGSRHEATDRELDEALRALLAFEPRRAEQLARSVLERSPSGDRARRAIELCSWSRLAEGDVVGAEQLIVSMPPGGGPSAGLRGALALVQGRTTEGVTTLAWAFTHEQDPGSKALGAIAVAQARQVEPVLRELLLLGPPGRQGAILFQGLLEHTGHHADARTAGVLLEASMPRPPGW